MADGIKIRSLAETSTVSSNDVLIIDKLSAITGENITYQIKYSDLKDGVTESADLNLVLANQNNQEVRGTYANILLDNGADNHIHLKTNLPKSDSLNPDKTISRVEVSDYNADANLGSVARIESDGNLTLADTVNPYIVLRGRRQRDDYGYGCISLIPYETINGDVQDIFDRRRPNFRDGTLTIQSGQIRIVDLEHPDGYILKPGNSDEVSNSSATVYETTSTPVEFVVTVGDKTTANRFNHSSSRKCFYINGVEAPSMTLAPGIRYRFTQEDESNRNYTLRFFSNPTNTEFFGNDYSSPTLNDVTIVGTAGLPGAYTELYLTQRFTSETTLAEESPTILFYNAHQTSGQNFMGNSILNVGSIELNAFDIGGGGGGGGLFPPYSIPDRISALEEKMKTLLELN